MRGLELIMWSQGQCEASKKTASHGANKQTHTQTDIATPWLNRPSGANSVKIAANCQNCVDLTSFYLKEKTQNAIAIRWIQQIVYITYTRKDKSISYVCVTLLGQLIYFGLLTLSFVLDCGFFFYITILSKKINVWSNTCQYYRFVFRVDHLLQYMKSISYHPRQYWDISIQTNKKPHKLTKIGWLDRKSLPSMVFLLLAYGFYLVQFSF